MAAEHGNAARRGFWASWPQAGVAAGNLLAAGVLALMAALQDEADFLDWGWRVPFLLSVLLVAVGWYIRNRVAESRTFEEALAEAEAPPKLPALDVLRERPMAVLLGAGPQGRREHLLLHPHRLLADLPRRREQRRAAALALNALLIGAAVQFFAIPFFGHLSDRIGRRCGLCVRRASAWRLELRLVPAAGERQTTSRSSLALVVGLVLHGAMYGPQAAMIAELFPTRIRYSGASIAYQLTAIFAGSLAPIIAVWLYKEYDSALPVAIYVAAACLISGVSALLARETKGVELADDPLRAQVSRSSGGAGLPGPAAAGCNCRAPSSGPRAPRPR